jgi:Antitoxin-like ribbon-helix-helix
MEGVVEDAIRPRDGQSRIAPSRSGRVQLAAHVHPNFKRSLRLMQAETGETYEALVTRALNNLFREHGVPVIDPVTGAEHHTTQETTTAA